jgi:serine/threonine-protein kinase
VRFSVELDAASELNTASTLLVSPDGRTLYATGSDGRAARVFVHRFDRMESTTLAGATSPGRPFLSPDGRWLGYTNVPEGKLYKVPIDGGAPVPIAPSRYGAATWGRDGTIVFTAMYNEGLSRVSQDGGTVTRLTTPDTSRGELGHWWPQFLPDGRHVLFCNYRTPLDRATIEVLDLRSGERQVLVQGGLMPRYAPSGHLIYARNSTIMAVAFDAATLRTHGSAVPMIEGVIGNFSDGRASYDVGANGTLVYAPDSLMRHSAFIVDVDRRGVERPLLQEPGDFMLPRLSPDRTRLAYSASSGSDPGDVWIRDLARGSVAKLSGTPGSDFAAAWTPDGREIVYDVEQVYFDLFRRPADLSRPAVPLFTGGGGDKIMSSVSPDGRLALFSYSLSQTSELWTVPLDGHAPPARYLQGDGALGHPVLSPDGRWMAYDGNESGTTEVYVRSFPDASAARQQVSSGGGSEPLWTKGGRELIYRTGDSVLAVAIDPATGQPGRPVLLLTGRYDVSRLGSAARSWDVTADGEHLILVKHPPELRARRINVVLNWFDELREKVPVQ